MTGPGRAGALALAATLGLGLVGCSLPAWVPLVGRTPPPAPGGQAAGPPAPVKPAPLLRPVRPVAAPETDGVIDRVICVVNNDAITEFELDEQEAYHYYETKSQPLAGEERKGLREQILGRMIDDRLQLQQAERDKVGVDDQELAEAMRDLMKRMGAADEAAMEATLRSQGFTLDSARKRVRERLMVQKLIRRKVTMRISVTEQEIDRYLEANRDKLETGLDFEARHMLFLPRAGAGEDGWDEARRRAEEAHARLLAGEDFAELAARVSEDASGKDGGALGVLKRGELAPEIEAAILQLRPGEASAPFRSGVGWHLFRLDARQMLAGEALTQARSQIRDILFREKYQVRMRDYVEEIKQRAVIDVRL